MLHVHIGPSALALGLLLPTSRQAGFDVALIGRPGARGELGYGRTETGPSGSLAFFPLQWHEGPERYADLPEDLRERVASEEPLLLTTTLRNEIEDRLPLIRDLLSAARHKRDVVVLVCENDPHEAYTHVEAHAHSVGAKVLHTVVNRMCVALPDDHYGRRRVSSHPLGEWLVERPTPPSALLDRLTSAEAAEYADDIVARGTRKLWMVNGAHQALAMAARQANLPHMEDAVRIPSVRTRLDQLHGEMHAALATIYPSMQGNLDYGEAHVLAYAEHPDGVDRVLAAFQRLDLVTFCGVLNARIADPARHCVPNGFPVDRLRWTIGLFDHLVQDLNMFSDAGQLVQGTEIDPAADAAAVEAYRAMLVSWFPADAAARRTAAFERTLASHRAILR